MIGDKRKEKRGRRLVIGDKRKEKRGRGKKKEIRQSGQEGHTRKETNEIR